MANVYGPMAYKPNPGISLNTMPRPAVPVAPAPAAMPMRQTQHKQSYLEQMLQGRYGAPQGAAPGGRGVLSLDPTAAAYASLMNGVR